MLLSKAPVILLYTWLTKYSFLKIFCNYLLHSQLRQRFLRSLFRKKELFFYYFEYISTDELSWDEILLIIIWKRAAVIIEHVTTVIIGE